MRLIPVGRAVAVAASVLAGAAPARAVGLSAECATSHQVGAWFWSCDGGSASTICSMKTATDHEALELRTRTVRESPGL